MGRCFMQDAFYVLMDTKQPASRLQQILGILDSDVIVTSEKYLKDLEKLGVQRKGSDGSGSCC